MILLNPNAFYEQNQNKGGVCEIKYAVSLKVGAVTNSSLIAAVTGKRLKILRFSIIGLTGAGTSIVTFKSASGGSTICIVQTIDKAIAIAAGNDPNLVHEDQQGLFETNAGEALVVDTSAAIDLAFNIKYLEYTA